MKQFNLYIIITIAVFLSSCNTLKDGFSNQKKNNSDEFLVEKKSPLVLPPDYNELPIPNEEMEKKGSNEIKSLITKSTNNSTKENSNEENSSFEKLILEKIKNN